MEGADGAGGQRRADRRRCPLGRGLCLLVPTLVPPAFGQGATAILVNRTGQTWQVRAEAMAPPRVPIRLTVTGPEPAGPATTLDVPGTAAAVLDLPPGASLAISHFEPAGGDVRRFLELRSDPGPGQPGPAEGLLYLRTAPAWVLWGPDRTVLAGRIYADGAAPRFRFTAPVEGVLHLEGAPAAAPDCLVSRRTWPRPCRCPWPEPGRPPAPAGAAG